MLTKGVDAVILNAVDVEGSAPIVDLCLEAGVPVIVIICIVAVLIQRIKEIKGGEEDEAAQY